MDQHEIERLTGGEARPVVGWSGPLVLTAYVGLVLLGSAVGTAEAGPSGWQQHDGVNPETAALMRSAEEMFLSADQAATIPLFDQVIERLRNDRVTGAVGLEPTLVRALLLRAEATFNLGDAAGAESGLREAIRLAPAANLDRDRASPKLAELFDQLRDGIVGTVAVRIEPVDATVTVDGQLADWGTGIVALVAGPHSIGVARTGYAEFQQQVDVVAGATVAFDAALERVSATVSLRLRPGDAIVSVDGVAATLEAGAPGTDTATAPSGNEPVTITGLGIGDHVLELAREGYRTRQETLSITALMDYRLEPISLVPTAGTIRLTDLPPGTDVRVDGGPAPLRRGAEREGTIELPPGQYRIDVDGGSLGSFRAEATVRDAEESRFEVRLRPTLAYLGVLGGDDLGRRTFEDAAARAFSPSSPWAWRGHAGVGQTTLQTNGVDTATVRGQLAEGGALPIGALQQSLASDLPASAYVLGVLDDDLMARRIDVLVWPAAPGPALADRLTLDLEGGRLAEELASAFAFRGAAEHPWLGAVVVDTDAATAPTIFAVTDGGPAARAGLLPGDQVVSLAGRALASAADVWDAVAANAPGAEMVMGIRRGAIRTEIAVHPGTSAQVLDPEDAEIVFGLAWLEAEVALSTDQARDSHWVLALNQVAALMHAHQWENAVRRLRTIDAPQRPGVGAGLVDYWLGLALAELGPDYEGRARDAFARAASAPGATLLSDDGPLIAPLARARIAYIGR